MYSLSYCFFFVLFTFCAVAITIRGNDSVNSDSISSNAGSINVCRPNSADCKSSISSTLATEYFGQSGPALHSPPVIPATPTTTKRPLLALTMIVKDEASSIEKVLRNAFQFVDRWIILDTGSTDGTQVFLCACFHVCV